MSVIDFTYLEGKDGELVNKLAAVDTHNSRVYSYLRDLTTGRICHCLNLEWIKLLTMGVIGMKIMYHRAGNCATSRGIICCCSLLFQTSKNNLLVVLSTVQLLTSMQLGSPPNVDINPSAISCTFACHNKSTHVCALRSAYSVAQWLHFYNLVCSMYAFYYQPAYRWFSRCGLGRYFDVTTASTRRRQRAPSTWIITSELKDWSSRSCVVKWPKVVHSGSIQGYTQRWNARNWELVIPYALWTVYPDHEWEHSSASK